MVFIRRRMKEEFARDVWIIDIGNWLCTWKRIRRRQLMVQRVRLEINGGLWNLSRHLRPFILVFIKVMFKSGWINNALHKWKNLARQNFLHSFGAVPCFLIVVLLGVDQNSLAHLLLPPVLFASTEIQRAVVIRYSVAIKILTVVNKRQYYLQNGLPLAYSKHYYTGFDWNGAKWWRLQDFPEYLHGFFDSAQKYDDLRKWLLLE